MKLSPEPLPRAVIPSCSQVFFWTGRPLRHSDMSASFKVSNRYGTNHWPTSYPQCHAIPEW